MELYKLTIHKDNNYNVMSELGKFGHVHFIDLNKDKEPYRLLYTPVLKAAEDAERKIM